MGNRSTEDLILIDNLIQSFSLDMANGIPVRDFIDDPRDQELKYIADVLQNLRSYVDCRIFIENEFKLSSFYKTL